MKVLIAIPVYNEEIILEDNIKKIVDFCRQNILDDEIKIIIADNKSSDRTPEISRRLAQELPEVEYLFIDRKGKGLAWRTAFERGQADVYIFMDIDLAVELSALKTLISGIKDGNDVVIGSRYLPDSKIERGLSRSIVSNIYRIAARFILQTPVDDFQCGFKAINQVTKDNVLPKTTNTEFFLDTEMLVLANTAKLRIMEVPVNWSDYRTRHRKSTVNLLGTSWSYFIMLIKLRLRLFRRSSI